LSISILDGGHPDEVNPGDSGAAARCRNATAALPGNVLLDRQSGAANNPASSLAGVNCRPRAPGPGFCRRLRLGVVTCWQISVGGCVGRCVGDVGAWAEALPNSFQTSGALRGAAVCVGRSAVTGPFTDPFAPGRGRRDQACAFRQAWRRLDNRQLVSRSRAAHLRGFRRRLPFRIHPSSTNKEGTNCRRAVGSYSRRDAGEDHNTGRAF
jgi:hypothetical protein